MSKPSCRRLSVAPLAGVERQGRGSLGGGGLAVGISHSLPSGSHFIQGRNPSLFRLIAPVPSGARPWRGRFVLFWRKEQ